MQLAEALGLPRPEKTGISDAVLRDEYVRFFEQLKVVADGRVVVSDPYQLSVRTDRLTESASIWYQELTDEERCRLLLLSVLARPFSRAELRTASERRFLDDSVIGLLFANQNPQSLAEHQAGMPFGLDTVAGRRLALAEPALKSLMDDLPTAAVLETISSEFIGGQPGNYAYQMWQIDQWSNEWAIVYGVTDAARDEGYPFPWLLGFCRMDRLERNFIRLLKEGVQRFDRGFYFTYGRVTSRWPIAPLALVADDDSEQPDWNTMYWLLEMDDDSLHRLVRDHVQGLDAIKFMARIRDLRRSSLDLDLADDSLSGLMERAQAGGSLAVLEAAIERWRRE